MRNRSIILEEAPDAVIAIDAGLRILSWNRGAERVYGYSAEEAVGARLDALVAASVDGDEALRKLAPFFVPGPDVGTFEAMRRRKDGLLIFVDITAKALGRALEGSTGPAVVLCEKDVTQIRVRRDSKHLETRFRDLFEMMPDAIVVLNATGRIVFVNTQAETLFGYAPGALIGEAVERLLPDRLRTAHLQHRSQYVQQPRVRVMGVGLELFGLRSDGQEIPVDVSLSPLQTPEGTLVLSAIRDATERRRFERVLRDKNDQLAAAMHAKDRFLATMSHELRTPLNAVIGFTGTLLMRLAGPLNAEQEKQLRTIQASGRHLLSLINDLLDLARMDADKLELHFEPLVYQEVLNGVCESLRPPREAKGLGLDFVMPEHNLVLSTDRRALTQILTNLIANAVKFCDTGGVTLDLREEVEGGERTVRLAVRDTGIGIAPEHVATLFDAFSRFEHNTSSREGSGLGLHISRRLAERLGGRIEVASELGKGSTFSLVLPGG
ncbi:PAS domain-containing sensor histidine kinase [Aquabacter spiritensis]|uniref:histidine kinase n=1 Tax=Aquabacter spiritensis TaxID=933073 RepID=A0A4R3LZS1_9HYPH|nr:PAS domain S-box protein [Aquabacter spiritensis]TCT06192.1 PAS/PAC sensor signal transduction histidine kinase [Aquabacter spiritensis]